MGRVKIYNGTGLKIVKSKLAPWQRLDALRTFFYPSLTFALRRNIWTKGDLKKIDDVLRPEIKKTLNVPNEASNAYIYGPRSEGCCGIPLLNDEADVFSIDSAFKLLSSKDPIVLELARSSVQVTVRDRLKRLVDYADVAKFLSGNDGDDFAGTSNQYSNSWTTARKASRRISVKWFFDNDLPTLERDNKIIRSSQRKLVCKILKTSLAENRAKTLQELPSQGKVMECVKADRASSHFMLTGYATRFADWRFIHRSRLNLVPLNAVKHSTNNQTKGCRRCNCELETLPHVLEHCMRNSDAYQKRHNCVVERIKKAALPKFHIISENQRTDPEINLRPDLVLVKNNICYIIDVTVPFENRMEAFKTAREMKMNKYSPLAESIKHRYADVKIGPIVVGALGSWDPNNNKFLTVLCTRKYGNLLRRLIVSDTIKWSRHIYIKHLTNIRQY